MKCDQCGGEFEIDGNGVTNHINDNGIDHDMDADHVPYAAIARMTYRQLRDWIDTLDELQLDDTVTVHLANSDEFVAISGTNVTVGGDVLHDNHAYLEVDA